MKSDVKLCAVCKNRMQKCFSNHILNKYDVAYYHCDECGLIQTEDPFWLDEAYNEAITVLDTGILSRNISISKKIALLFYYLFGKEGIFLDSAGGYGLFTRFLRDFGFECFWFDKYCPNLFAKGFEFIDRNVRCHAVTAFEVLEHILDPLSFIQENLSFAKSDTIVFSTVLYKGKVPEPGSWWYYAPESGQHITFYTRETLRVIAEKLEMNLYSANNLHILSKNKLNGTMVKILLSPISELLFFYIYFAMNSKTMSDHEYMKKVLTNK